MSGYYEKPKAEIEISPIMLELRDRLTEAGHIWKDASDEFGGDGYCYHMERTKVLGPHGEIASCIYGYSDYNGVRSGSTYGWPDMIEGWPAGQIDPAPMTVDEIVEACGVLHGTVDEWLKEEPDER